MPDKKLSKDSSKKQKRQTLFDKEEEVLKFWEANKIFEKSLDKNPKEKVFSFYDGPPFITGMPHYGTLLPSIAKDIVPRYQTMKGNYVSRVWGWDVHGLPIENKVEEELGLKNKRDIEKLGIKKFIEKAREYVNVNTEEWRWYVNHIGRWADMDNAYRTDNINYMETVFWAFKQIYDKGLIYKGWKVFLYCTRCATVVSKFETTMEAGNYKEVEDPAVTIAFKLKNDKDTFVLAWTTTPWTLPANNGLAVGENIEYVKITDGKRNYILAKAALNRYPEFADWKEVESLTGKDLAGKSFEPLLEPNITPDPKKDYKINLADFPTTEDGTGVVHIAPAFGEDDFEFGQEHGLTVPIILDEEGKYLEDTPWPWKGKYFKDTDPDVIEALKEKGLLVKQGKIVHQYPHCYRCGTPLVYMAQDSWMLNIDKVRKDLLKTNKDINWVPSHFGDKRFVYNIETAPEWSISRTRYWGIPIPIWETDDGERIVPGSIEEVEKLSGQKVTDLHRPYIDEIVLKTKEGKEAHRIPEVLDVWFESGSMPYAQDHYPFENKEKFEEGFPADFIIEHTGQLRGWFYSLHVLSNALKGSVAFKNAVVTGTLMGTDGRKMSKSFNNYPDPKETIEKYGAESLRLYFMGSKIMNGEDLNLSEEDIKEQANLLNILHNSLKYFLTYADIHSWKPSSKESGHILDRWITARLEQFINDYSAALDKFEFVPSTRAIRPFIEDLSTWYIRRSRNRFASGDDAALNTLYKVLLRFAITVAPTLPFSAETIYRSLSQFNEGAKESVHLEDYPEADVKLAQKEKHLIEDMEFARAVSSAAHSLRAEIEQPIRQKLGMLVIKNLKELEPNDNAVTLVKEEVNVAKIEFDKKTDDSFVCAKIGDIEICLDTKLTDELKKEGLRREIMRALQDARKKAGLSVGQKASLEFFTEDKSIAELLEEEKDSFAESAHFSQITRIADAGEALNAMIEGSGDILGGKARIKIK